MDERRRRHRRSASATIKADFDSAAAADFATEGRNGED
jgi:hypothetical protein